MNNPSDPHNSQNEGPAATTGENDPPVTDAAENQRAEAAADEVESLFKRERRVKLVLSLILTITVLTLAWRFTNGNIFDAKEVRDLVAKAGFWGVLAYIGLYSIRDVIRIPPLVLNFAAVLAYGKLWGGLLAFVGVNISVNLAFYVLRKICGQIMTKIRRPLLQRILRSVEKRPMATVVIARTVLYAKSPVNCAFAISSLRFRDHFIGSLVGLIIPTFCSVFLSEVVIQ